MTKHKTTELEGALLDEAVAMAEGLSYSVYGEDDGMQPQVLIRGREGNPCFSPSTFWDDAEPIIERFMHLEAERIPGAGDAEFGVSIVVDGKAGSAEGPSLRVAAMRAYVAAKPGDEVEL